MPTQSNLTLTPIPFGHIPPYRLPAERYAEWKLRKYFVPLYRPKQEIAVRDIIAFENDAHLPVRLPQRFERPIVVQAIPNQEAGQSATCIYIGLIGYWSDSGVIYSNNGNSRLIANGECLCFEEATVLKDFLETLFGVHPFQLPVESNWRSHDLVTHLPNPFPSGKTWADMPMPKYMQQVVGVSVPAA